MSRQQTVINERKTALDILLCMKQKNEPLDFDYEFNNENLFITSQFSEFYHKCFLEILKNIPNGINNRFDHRRKI